MADGVAEAVFSLFGVRRALEVVGAREDRHADEVDEVARDDEPPAVARRWCPLVVAEEVREVRVDALRSARPIAREVVQVVAEMNVRKDEQAFVERMGEFTAVAKPVRPAVDPGRARCDQRMSLIRAYRASRPRRLTVCRRRSPSLAIAYGQGATARSFA